MCNIYFDTGAVRLCTMHNAHMRSALSRDKVKYTRETVRLHTHKQHRKIFVHEVAGAVSVECAVLIVVRTSIKIYSDIQ